MVHTKFKFHVVSGTRSLESTNMRGTTKVLLGSNLTRTCFFFQTENIVFQILLVCSCFVGLVTVELVVLMHYML